MPGLTPACVSVKGLALFFSPLPESQMRYISVAFCFGAIGFALSCRPQPEKLVGGPGVVNIVLNCDPDGEVNFRIVPWRQGIATRNDDFTWRLARTNNSIDSVEIWPADEFRWPFLAPPPIKVTSTTPGVGSGLKNRAEAPAGIYRYKITGICVRSETSQDAIVIDPDMIIPN